ncbi:coiled-coil and C2 domain-containing protein 1 [Mytilus galloprovincialis]|uniref:Coiled-coil and C2 domain-containing protein 1 n=1 Tax=Mytilus galloprovincialis TaxID=29158 RepID=A0A8B6EIF5_MYTGA|nr:coiled-coil and C2 domain-containing protein 1 [Mytilus galloprovincialis]
MEDVPDEIFDDFETSETETEVYCHCKSDDVADLIECEGPDCKIKFYHIRCVGLNVSIDDGPSDWVCYECLGHHKPTVVSAFTLEKAKESAKTVVLDSLKTIRSESFCKPNDKFSDMLTVTVEKLENSNAANDNCEMLIMHIWPSVIEGDNSKQLISTRLEKKAASFHQIRGSADIKLIFISFMDNLKIENYSDRICRLVLQFLLQQLFQELMKKRHPIPSTSGEKTSVLTISESEEQALRFTAGYICRKLSRHFTKYQRNPMHAQCRDIIKNFKISESEVDTRNLLSYTKEWLILVNRGGLFSVSDSVYMFFKEMEIIIRSNLNRASSSLHVTKDELHQQIEDSESVNQAFMELMKDTESDDIKLYLLNKFITCWVNLRLKAFSNVFMYIKKKLENSISRKSQKSMRKELNKEN